MKLQFRSDHERYTYFAWKRPAAAACCILLYKDEVLIIKRSNKSAAHPGEWSLPGGFLDVDKETLEDCCVREIEEELSVSLDKKDLKLFSIDSNPSTDPRTHVVCAMYYIKLSEKPEVTASDDAIDFDWVKLSDAAYGAIVPLAFNHNNTLYKLYVER